MIKGLYYLKFLKLFLFGFLISCFTVLGGGVNAFDLSKNMYVRQNGYYGFSPYDQNFDIQVVNKGNMLTSQIGMTLRGVYLSGGTYIVRRYSNDLGGIVPYLSYVNKNNTQTAGYPTYYSLCDKFDGDNHIEDYNLSGCSTYELNQSSLQLITNFMSGVSITDSFGFSYKISSYPNYPRYNNGGLLFCFSSNSYNKSMCFGISEHTYGNDYIYPGFSNNTINYTGYNQSSLPYSFTDLINSDISLSPGTAGYGGDGNIEGGSQDVGLTEMTGDVMNAVCTKEMAYEWYRANGYKSRMCYSSYLNNTDIFEGAGTVSAFALTGTDIRSIYQDTCTYRRYGESGSCMEYSDWFSYWRKSYNVYKNNRDIQNPFIGVPVAVFTLMGNVDAYGLPYNDASVMEFCSLSLYSNLSNPYVGIASSSVCSMSSIDFLDVVIANSLNPDDGYPGYSGSPNTGTVSNIGSSWVGITNRPGFYNIPGTTGSVSVTGSEINTGLQDGLTFQNSFFNGLKNSFKFPTGNGSGVLPSYIIIAMCGLIFFRFLRH